MGKTIKSENIRSARNYKLVRCFVSKSDGAKNCCNNIKAKQAINPKRHVKQFRSEKHLIKLTLQTAAQLPIEDKASLTTQQKT